MADHATAAAAQELTKFLLDRGPYKTQSPLQDRVQREIEKMAQEIARDVVAENPALRDVIRRQVQDVIAVALRDDAYLNRVVIDAVSKGLGRLVSGEDAS